MRFGFLVLALLMLVGCAVPPPAGGVVRGSVDPEVQAFAAVVDRVAPVAERECRDRTQGRACGFRIFLDGRPDAPPNAYQTEDRRGRPIIIVTEALIDDTRNADELAFVLGHEAAHHILGHLPRTRDSAQLGAAVFGQLAQAAGQTPEVVAEAERLGAAVGARRFAKAFELEADQLGTVIAARAGYDPRLGAQFFDRIPDPGNRFLGTHPPNAERAAAVARTLAELGLP
jgi:Zn-dependent protease with chaperone function